MNYIEKMKLIMSCFIGKRQAKYEARHISLAAFAKKMSFRLYNKNLLWFSDKEFQDVWKKFPARVSDEIHERRFNLYYLAKSVSDIAGDTVECGVFEGASSYLILKTNADKGKIHHIFDSFDGLSKPGDQDLVENERTFRWKEHDLKISEEVTRMNLSCFKNVAYYKGWIPDKFYEVQDRKFSFVHIDVDLFQPTHDALIFFYERMTPGGMIICDDYGFETCSGAYKAMNEFVKDKPESIIHLTTGQGVIIKQH